MSLLATVLSSKFFMEGELALIYYLVFFAEYLGADSLYTEKYIYIHAWLNNCTVPQPAWLKACMYSSWCWRFCMFLPLNMCLSLPSLTCQGEHIIALYRQNVNKPMVRFSSLSSLLWPTLARSRSLRLTSGLSEEETSWEKGAGAGRQLLRLAAAACRGASLSPALTD